MKDIKRRTFTKAAGASLLGVTTTGLSTAAEPTNEAVSFLELYLNFDFGTVKNLRANQRDSPIKYALGTTHHRLQVLTAPEDEKQAFKDSSRVVDFRGAESGVSKVGGIKVHNLNRRIGEDGVNGLYVFSESGYEVPELEINWNATSPGALLKSPGIQEITHNGAFFELTLPTTEIEVPTKIVHDERVDREDIPEWRRAKKTTFSTETVQAKPYLTAAYHQEVDVVIK